MSKQRNEDIGRRWYEEMWNKPDLDVADEIVDKLEAPHVLMPPEAVGIEDDAQDSDDDSTH